jgi:hypothetical protein
VFDYGVARREVRSWGGTAVLEDDAVRVAVAAPMQDLGRCAG